MAPIALDSHCRYSQGTVHSVDDRLGTYSGSGHPQHPPLAANPWQALAEVSPGVYLKRGTSSCLSANFVNGYFGRHNDDTVAWHSVPSLALLTSLSALNGDWPALTMQKENDAAVFQLLLRLKQGN